MKIYICCSRHLYGFVPQIQAQLEKAGHLVEPPNGFDSPEKEKQMQQAGKRKFENWKEKMLCEDIQKIKANDAVLVLNFEKNGQKNYVGAATFLEMYNAWRRQKKVFLFNPIPENMLKDEIAGLKPVVLNGDLSQLQTV